VKQTSPSTLRLATIPTHPFRLRSGSALPEDPPGGFPSNIVPASGRLNATPPGARCAPVHNPRKDRYPPRPTATYRQLQPAPPPLFRRLHATIAVPGWPTVPETTEFHTIPHFPRVSPGPLFDNRIAKPSPNN
jgi:hypothetical protein